MVIKYILGWSTTYNEALRKPSGLHSWQFIMAIKRQTSPYSITRIIDLKEGAMIEVHGRKLKAQSWR
jgi:hypothetical protein